MVERSFLPTHRLEKTVIEEIKVVNPTVHRFPRPGVGRVDTVIRPDQKGRVKYEATYWPARLYDPTSTEMLMPGAAVTVIGRLGLTLLVLPA